MQSCHIGLSLFCHIYIFAAVVLGASPIAHAGKLADTRDSSRRDNEGSDSSDGGILSTFLGALFGRDDEVDDYDVDEDCRTCARINTIDEPGPRPGVVLSFPYAEREYGRYAPAILETQGLVAGYGSAEPEYIWSRVELDEPGSKVGARLSGEYAYDLDGKIHRPSLRAFIDTEQGVGLHTSWTEHIEPLGSGAVDTLLMGVVNLAYRLALNEKFVVNALFGLRIIPGKSNQNPWDNIGPNLGLLIDVFPVRPVVFSALVEAGTWGKTPLISGRISVGAALGHFEPYVGFDGMVLLFKTGAPVAFFGPNAGLRVWF